MATPETNPALRALEGRMTAYHLRGQWQVDPSRSQSVREGAHGALQAEPVPAGIPHLWKWQEMLVLLRNACEAMTESNTARRSLTFANPGLQRGTTQTLVAAFQIVPPGEIAWAHRHTINALRFAIQGGEKAFTVVDGRPLMMQPYDLILTPGWSWHEHHNDGDNDAIWMDGLDVPFTLALNQSFYEELGDVEQKRIDDDSACSPLLRPVAPQRGGARPYRYPWSETRRVLQALAREPIDPADGCILDYVNPRNGGPVLHTINCQIQYLPPGFEGRRRRRTSSSVVFVVEGEGRAVFGDRELDWGKHDSMAIPNWAWHRLINRSQKEPAILFSISDAPILTTFGLYREESEDGVAVSPAAPAFKLSAAE